MKNYILLILLFCANTCYGNAIDKIKSKRDVIKFIDRHFPDTVYHESQEWLFFHPDFASPSDSFYIVDFDKNGTADLIIDGAAFWVILANRAGKYKMLDVTGAEFTPPAAASLPTPQGATASYKLA